MRRPVLLAPRFASNRLWLAAREVPSLDLRFAEGKSLIDAVTGQWLVTFTRASTATYTDSQGVIRTATTDEPRFDHNPTTGESLGLLVEEQRTNLVTWSQDFSQTDWSKNASIIVSTAIASPISGVNYQKIEASTANTTVGVTSIPVTAASQQRAVSFFAKPLGNITRVLVVVQGADARININLIDGTATTNATATGSTVTVSGERFTVSTPSLTNATGVRFFLKRTGESDTNTPTTIAIGEGLYLIGAQMEAGAFPTSYIPTTTATVTRSADAASISGSNFSSWYRQDEGTIFNPVIPRGSNIAYSTLSDGTSNNRFQLYAENNGVLLRTSASGSAANNSIGSQTVGVPSTVAYAYGSGGTAASLNGGSVSSTTQALPTTNSVLGVGQYFASTTANSIHHRRLTYWRRRLPNNVLQAITAMTQ
jgi:hypothetical protein